MPTGAEFSSAKSVYRPSLVQRMGACGPYAELFVICCLLFSVFLQAPLQIAWKIGVLPLFALLAAVMAVMALWRAQAILVTSPEGIAYSTLGFRIFTPWENVEGRGTRSEKRSVGRGSSSIHVVSGLKLRQPAPVFEIRPWVRFMLAEIQDDPSLFIPISDVVEDWQDSEVAQDIRRYAPQGLREVET